MASLIAKVERVIDLEPGERVTAAAFTPRIGAPDAAGRAPRSKVGAVPAIFAGLGAGVAVAIRPGELAIALVAGMLTGAVGGAVGWFVESRRRGDRAPDPSSGPAMVAATDRRLLYGPRAALASKTALGWRDLRFDDVIQVEMTERKKMGVVTGFTFALSTAGGTLVTFELPRPKDAEAFRLALAGQVLPPRPV